ncbi:MAG: dTMP kinase [Arcanobacterium sp.]
MAGLFISFEGSDGSGKSTQARLLAQWLGEQGYDVVLTREPGGTELGQEIRQLLLHGSDMDSRAEALLFAADRAHHVASKIRPALERGAIVITDRYLDSSVAYQGAARDLPRDEVRDLSLWAVQNLLPELTIVVDASVAVAKRRVGDQLDRMEAEGDSFQDRVRTQFLELADQDPGRFVVVDGERAIDAVAAEVQQIVGPYLGQFGVAPAEL